MSEVAIELTQEWSAPEPPAFDFDLRRCSAGTLAQLLAMCEPGSRKHVALLEESRQRRRGTALRWSEGRPMENER